MRRKQEKALQQIGKSRRGNRQCHCRFFLWTELVMDMKSGPFLGGVDGFGEGVYAQLVEDLLLDFLDGVHAEA